MTLELQGRPVLVTGAGGFIGSHLVEALATAGARVRALVHYHSRGDWGQLERVAPDVRAAIEVVAGDLRDPFFVDRAVAGCERVFHLGAVIPIPYSYVAPSEYVDTNVRGTLHVLEAVRHHAVQRLIHVSTSETYGTAQRTPIDESHPLQAQSPYAASKIGADQLAEAYARSFAVPVVTVRPFNTYGPRQSARAFLPAVLTQALTSEVVRVGALEPVRDMNYVSDTVAGLVAAATAPGVEGAVINLGSGRGVSMRELLEIALAAVGRRPRIEAEEARRRPERSEVMTLVCDATRARERLGWTSRVGLEEGVRRTAAWISDHLRDYQPGRYAL